MKTRQHVIMVAIAALAVALPARADEPQLAQLSWLAGCWQAADGEPGTLEQWTPPAGDSMLGVSRTVAGGRTVMYEFMRIAPDDAGRVTFFAQPRGVTPTGFPAVSITATEVVFENAAHDFPQRVVYRFVAPATLRAHIEGVADGKVQRIEYHFVRAACAAAG
jgi:Domain of unknown function (DUF6265)